MDRVDFESPFLLGELPTTERRSLRERVRALALELHPAAAADMDLAARELEVFEAELRGEAAPASGRGPDRRFEGQLPPTHVQLPLRGRVVIGDGLGTTLVPTRLEVWISSRDAHPGAAGFPNAIQIVAGLVPSATTVASLTVPAANPVFEMMVPVPLGAANPAILDCFLCVRAHWTHRDSGGPEPRECVVRMPLRLSTAAASPFRVVIMHPDAAFREYVWTSAHVIRAATLPMGGRGSLTVTIPDSTHSTIPYRAGFTCNTSGNATTENGLETVFAVPRQATVLARIAMGNPGTAVQLVRQLANPGLSTFIEQWIVSTQALYWPRADFFTFTAAQRTHAPVRLELRPTNVSTNAFAGRRIALDPGHGLNYELDSSSRFLRVYEWFVAHRTMTAVAEAWRALGGEASLVPSARFKTEQMRIVVDLVGSGAAAMTDAKDVTLVVDRRATPHTFTVRVENAAFSLANLANALGYNDRPDAAARSLPFKGRASFITDYPAFFTTLENRAAVPAGFTLVAGSSVWNADRYEVTMRRAGVPDRKVRLTIRQNDALVLGRVEVTFLARASILRSYRSEAGNPYKQVIGDATNRDLPGRALIDYAVRVLVEEEGRSLKPAPRRVFMQAQAPTFFVTSHHNAGGANGTAILMRHGTTVTDPAARVAKRFLKYVDPLDKGKHGTGQKFSESELVVNPPSADRYVYFETDFMDTPERGAPGGVRYGLMVDDDRFILPLAEQIVSGLVEMIFAAQPDAQIDAANIGAPDGPPPGQGP